MTKDEMFKAVSEQEDAFFEELQALRAKYSGFYVEAWMPTDIIIQADGRFIPKDAQQLEDFCCNVVGCIKHDASLGTSWDTLESAIDIAIRDYS
jgi:hypothetical protein